jgi:hypothetical protein
MNTEAEDMNLPLARFAYVNALLRAVNPESAV